MGKILVKVWKFLDFSNILFQDFIIAKRESQKNFYKVI